MTSLVLVGILIRLGQQPVLWPQGEPANIRHEEDGNLLALEARETWFDSKVLDDDSDRIPAGCCGQGGRSRWYAEEVMIPKL